MRQLFLLRHAQAMPGDGKSDKTRKLSPNGMADARALGREMKRKQYKPDMALCSTAIRTRETLAALAESAGTPQTSFLDSLYDDGQGEILKAIQDTDDEVQSLLVVGHNPSIHALAVMLAREEAPMLMNRLGAGYAPGTLTVLSCSCESWAAIQPGANALIDLLEPLDYNAPSTPARWT